MESSCLRSSWRVAQEAGEAQAVIRVRNIQTSLIIGKDAWGRESKQQPVLISIAVSLRKAFESASNEDAVTQSTVHYGSLTKAIMGKCDQWNKAPIDARTLKELLLGLVRELTHRSFTGETVSWIESGQPLLAPSILKALEIKIMLPKASLTGNGVSHTCNIAYSDAEDGPAIHNTVLELHDLRILTLIGVNLNERLAKQIVIANIEIDRWLPLRDCYNELEEIVTKVGHLMQFSP